MIIRKQENRDKGMNIVIQAYMDTGILKYRNTII